MSYVFQNLKPERMWHYFYELNQIPRESKHELDAAAWVVKVAKELNLEVKQDEVFNVLVSKPATPGFENAPKVCIQGHLDMVCEKNTGTEHDFRKDPIDMFIEGDFVKARGTTLGADNGIGLAAALAIMESDDIVHPPMEFLFTIDEETGLTGANAIKEGFVTSDILINGDSEEDGVLYVGCAGGQDTEMKMNIQLEDAPTDYVAVKCDLNGFKGGHSGLDINEGRGNASIQLNRLLWNSSKKLDIKLYFFAGGTKHNAIPREAFSKLLVAKTDIEQFKTMVTEFENTLKSEYAGSDDGVKMVVEEISEKPTKVFTKKDQEKLMNLIYVIPHGVKAMSKDIPDLVETSTNLAIVTAENGKAEILTSQRSSVESEKIEIADKVMASGLLAGAEVYQGGGYPGWEPNMDSNILKTMKEVYKNLFGHYPAIKAIHAGLECGIIGETKSGMDMISFGPTIKNPHSPDEMLQISTVNNFWNILLATLKTIAQNS